MLQKQRRKEPKGECLSKNLAPPLPLLQILWVIISTIDFISSFEQKEQTQLRGWLVSIELMLNLLPPSSANSSVFKCSIMWSGKQIKKATQSHSTSKQTQSSTRKGQGQGKFSGCMWWGPLTAPANPFTGNHLEQPASSTMSCLCFPLRIDSWFSELGLEVGRKWNQPTKKEKIHLRGRLI